MVSPLFPVFRTAAFALRLNADPSATGNLPFTGANIRAARRRSIKFCTYSPLLTQFEGRRCIIVTHCSLTVALLWLPSRRARGFEARRPSVARSSTQPRPDASGLPLRSGSREFSPAHALQSRIGDEDGRRGALSGARRRNAARRRARQKPVFARGPFQTAAAAPFSIAWTFANETPTGAGKAGRPTTPDAASAGARISGSVRGLRAPRRPSRRVASPLTGRGITPSYIGGGGGVPPMRCESRAKKPRSLRSGAFRPMIVCAVRSSG